MNRWKMRAVAVLAVITLTIVGCEQEGADDQMNDDLLSPSDMIPRSPGESP